MTGRRIQAAGGATRTGVRDRSHSAGKRAHGIAANLRLRSAQGKDEAQATVRRITAELAALAERAATGAEALLANARRALRRARATRPVSLHDGDARPIAKGQLGKPVHFGYKAQVVDNDDGVVLDHTLRQGNPADAPQLAPAVERVMVRTSRKPRTVTTDRSYGEASMDDALRELGVRHVVIPRKGKPGKARQAQEHRPAFRSM